MLQLAPLFSDGMVLVGERPICVWGWTDHKQVTVSIQGITIAEESDGGQFQAWLPPLMYCCEETLVVSAEEESIEVRNVAVGEVWIGAGQSNMEFQMYFDRELGQVIPGEVDVRCFSVPEIAAPEALERFDYSDMGRWRKSDQIEDLRFHSAVGFYFAREIARKTGHVVGVIDCSWGGTACAPWVEESELKDPANEWLLQAYAEATADASAEELKQEYLTNPASGRGKPFEDQVSCALLFGMGREGQEALIAKMMPPKGNPGKFHPPLFSKPGILFENMVRPLAPYGVKGVLWYQGEADSAIRPDSYGSRLTALIRSWRRLWKEEIPFYVVQLPSFGWWLGFGGEPYVPVRREQEKAADEIEGVYLISAMDCGARWNTHPPYKRRLGERLAKAALKESYGYEILAASPRVDRIEAQKGKISLTFTDTAGELVWREELEGYGALQVLINEVPIRDFWWEVNGDRMVVVSPSFLPDVYVELRFAQQGYDPVNVFNREGFSLRPFVCKVRIES